MNNLISRQAAYDTLTGYYHHTTEIQHKALREALERVPSTQPETHDKRTETHECDLISRQAAIDICNNAIDLWHGQLGEGIVIAIKKKIEELPSAQPVAKDINVPVKDCISRQAAIDALHMHLMYRMGTDSNKKRLDDWINGLPSAQPEIIRCTDCKYYYAYDYTGYLACHLVVGATVRRKSDDFCSYAKKTERTEE